MLSKYIGGDLIICSYGGGEPRYSPTHSVISFYAATQSHDLQPKPDQGESADHQRKTPDLMSLYRYRFSWWVSIRYSPYSVNSEKESRGAGGGGKGQKHFVAARPKFYLIIISFRNAPRSSAGQFTEPSWAELSWADDDVWRVRCDVSREAIYFSIINRCMMMNEQK